MTISRRDFLKLSALLTASTVMRPGLELLPSRVSSDPNAKNVLIILFDTLSACNINFYGYPRETMPNLTHLLERATVYHNHYASSNFTTPGTASLLTGRHVWDHRAMKLSQDVRTELTERNIFAFFDDYYKLAYTHNPYADILLSQFSGSITYHEFFKYLFLEFQRTGSISWFDNLIKTDVDTASLFKSRLNDTSLDGYLYSLLFPNLLGLNEFTPPAELEKMFPRGFPISNKQYPYILEDGIDWALQQVTSIPQPFLSYIHFMPPHDPFNTRAEFVDRFLNDGFQPPEKPSHAQIMPRNNLSFERQLLYRQQYDEFILYVDYEFNRLFTQLDQQGILDNTIVVLTSDHGEIIERGERTHNSPFIFEPVIKIPLIIFEPGQTARRDVHSLTSCIDVLPTLLAATGHDVPANLPGKILPSHKKNFPEDGPRTIYSLYARENPGNSHITTASITFRRENMKVIRYSGYAETSRNIKNAEKYNLTPITTNPYYEVFDLENDPEELNNLAIEPTSEIQALTDEMEQFFREKIEYQH